jgi:adenylate kinase family enzyme
VRRSRCSGAPSKSRQARSGGTRWPSLILVFQDRIPRRVLFYGVTGSGKSTAASRFADLAGLPLHLVDELTWLPGWVEVPDDEQRRRIEAICEGEEWVLDTAYTRWLDIPMGRVELIVGLDYPRWLSLARLVRRTVSRVTDRTPVCNGNYETWGKVLSGDSIVRWHFASFSRKRALMREWADAPGGWTIRLFRSPHDLDRWLESITAYQDR